MITTENIVNCFISELVSALTPLVGASSTLKGKVPQVISSQIEAIGEASKQMAEEVIRLREHLDERIDVKSPARVAEQIGELVSNWRRYETILSNSITQIQASGTKMEDPALDTILNESLPGGLNSLRRILAFLESVEPKHLTPYDGFFEIPEI